MKYVLMPGGIYPQSESAPAFSHPHGARATYFQTLLRFGITPLCVSPLTPIEVGRDILEHCAGLFLIGGADIDPRLYGSKPHRETRVSEPERDAFEIALIQYAVEQRIPVLGICRGCQALGVALGGTLIQHVADHVKSEEHSADGYHNLPNKERHPVLIERDSKAFSLLGVERGTVNSGHHQAVSDPGPHLRIVARSPEGICEIIEHRDREYFCFGLQSHPEVGVSRVGSEQEFLEPIIRAFCDAVQDCSGG